ncbi:glycosyltransferase [Pantoea sp. JK]|uniref:glycosyltransferase n=1 Tax=Pantoea sp. JK TaxID=2871703 RepID=UPI002236FD9E|nr:glycosyltransferase [Pantoea sp. JK]MCW6033885.1 glycosyltransferase [Pantoea sp. JK]
MKNYDLVIITNVPAFYKINLFNQLSDKLKLKVIFISKISKIRNHDFYNYDINFDHAFLSEGAFEDRSSFKTLYNLFIELTKIKYERVLFPGWEIKELFFLSLITKVKKNAIVIESSINESKVKGISGFLKKIYLSRMGSAYPSGFLQKEILLNMDFKGRSYLTHGVGIINDSPVTDININEKVTRLKYIYIGRLSQEKNLLLLIKVFNELQFPLIIVGTGPQEDELKSAANENIIFKGYIQNKTLHALLKECNVFILPSISEPWGLVVEEALASGLPVVVSNKVGCNKDLVDAENGIIFNPHDAECLKTSILNMEKNYSGFKYAALNYNIQVRNTLQINSYVESMKNEK